ncbi:MAG: hypothetical protein ACOC2W_01125 [bacterium]
MNKIIDKKERLKNEINYLNSVLKRLEKIKGLAINNKVRVQISNLLCELVEEGRFERKNYEKKKIVCLEVPNWGEVISISVDNKGEVWVHDWPLLKLMTNYNEQINEIIAYENKYRKHI